MAPTSARRWAVAATTPWVVWAALRRTGGERGFPLVPALSFTPYAAGTALLPLAVAVRARSRSATVLAAGAGAVLAGAVRSHRGRRPVGPPPAGRRLRIATVSLRRGLVPAGPVVELVRRHRIDLLAVQELTPVAEQRLLAAGLAELLPHAHVVPARPGSEPAASGAVWSRLPLGARTVAPGGFEQPAVRLPGTPELEVVSVHTRPPATSPAAVRGWTEDLAALPGPEPAVLRVLAGDFNATLDHAALRAVLRRGYLDAARAVGRGNLRTWSPLRSPVPRLGLDHVLVDPRLAVAGCDVVPVAGSDHRSVVVDLVVPGG
ncbi:endonuclease/exonuclease/phosphatase family protein [Blastococcus sp. KM273128]|uniref:endonuclease/exonuclease/phosphatase family protein n=1 Tax=Blastococcus sp. KM273128 TaxID=2570314 RepID=UPI001F409BF6|nr:endonuclease/exonuclease/phosphatase family protein [Blastococcus sp. KM273128]MCF6744920.1 endonuclease/exonuclease/phosphatase family protein [Blastococcus sp. KM273128]